MKKIRVAIVTANFEKVGPNHGILSIIRSLDQERFEFYYIALAAKGWGVYLKDAKDIRPELEQTSAKILNLKIPKGLDIFFAIPKLVWVLRKIKPNVVNSHLMRPSLVARVASGILRIPNVSVLHNEDHWVTSKSFVDRVTHWIDRRTFRFVDLFVAVAMNVKEFFLDHEPKLADSDIVVVNNAVDPKRFTFDESLRASKRAELGYNNDEVLIGTVARVDYQKDPETLLKAFAKVHMKFPNAKFLFAGEGPMLSEMKTLAKELGLENAMSFLGQRNDVREIFLALDIFVLTSRFEGLPMSLLEAMASRCAPVATAVSGNKVVIQHGVNGLLAKPGDPGDVATQIASLVDNSALRATMAKNAEQRVIDEYSLEKFSNGYAKAFESVLERAD